MSLEAAAGCHSRPPVWTFLGTPRYRVPAGFAAYFEQVTSTRRRSGRSDSDYENKTRGSVRNGVFMIGNHLIGQLGWSHGRLGPSRGF